MKKTIDLLVYCLICQKCLKGYKQIDSFIENKSSPYLCSFRKNQNAQYSLLKMIENWQKQLENGEKVRVIFKDLSKAFDMVNHSLLLAKLKAYDFLTKL